VPALLGRCIGYLPGAMSFTSKVLFGSVANAQMTGRDYGDNESLMADRFFSAYTAEGPRGSHRFGYTPNGEFVDRPWLADYATYLAQVALVQWMQLNDITAYDDVTILGGRNVLARAIASLPAVNASTLVVTFLTRAQVDPNDIALRVYKYYATFADTNGIINQIGTLAEPIAINLKDAG